ncbi:MAG: HAD family hydrolase [Candidatus Parvarchaeota archaeon]|jgi:HAD superfamily hydrolase (TIGR01549 family)|nr:HAD family hydrolase [Candidatus Parvarchaeota archaeon]
MSEKIKAKALIFDFDNTLVDTHSTISGAYSRIVGLLSSSLGMDSSYLMQQLLNAQKEVIDDIPLVSRQYDRKAVIKKLNENLSLNMNEKQIDELAQVFYDFILEKIDYSNDTEEVLKALKSKGKKLGLLTDTDVRPGLKKKRLDSLGFTKLFDEVLIAGEDIPQRKNSPIPFIELARLLNVEPESILVVGDRMDADIDNAKEAGMKAVLIDKYLPPNTGVHKPDAVIHELNQLLEIVD